MPRRMMAWEVAAPGPLDTGPLVLVGRPVPEPGPNELLIRITACAMCRIDLHLVQGDLPPRRPGVVPGHEAVGRVEAVGADVLLWEVGQRAGIPWLRRTCGVCRYCERGAENLCLNAEFTGWDADGAFAEYATVPAVYAYRMPEEGYTDAELAPLLCGGITAWRARALAQMPMGGRLGIYGYGTAVQLAAQVAVRQTDRVHVFSPSASERQLALDLGAVWAGDPAEQPPEPLRAAMVFAPAGDLVPVALSALERAGTLVIVGVHLSDLPALRYAEHLYFERTVRSVTSNTRRDGQDFLAHAAAFPLRVAVTPYRLDQADRALADFAADRVTGAAVLA